MAKRFTDTDKWKKPFLRAMKAPYKLLWIYILDECDHAGIWQVDLEVAEIKIGEKLKIDDALKYFDGKILVLDNGNKWFIFDFIEFQYGTLNPENRAHNSVLNILKKYHVLDENLKIKPLISPLQGAKDKDKDMDKDMVKDKDMDKEKENRIYFFENISLKKIEYEKLINEFSEDVVSKSIKFLSDYKIEKGYKTKDDNLTIRRWVIKAVTEKSQKEPEKKQSILVPIIESRNKAHDLIDSKYGNSDNTA